MCPWGSPPRVTLLNFWEMRQRPLCQVRAISCNFKHEEQIVNKSLIFSPTCLCLVSLSDSVSVQQLFLEGERSQQPEEGIPFGRWITWWEWLGLRGLAADQGHSSSWLSSLMISYFFFIFEKQVNILTISSTSWPSRDIKAEKNYCWWQTKRPEYLSGVIIAVSEECLKPDPEFTAWTRAQRGIWFENPSSNAVEYPCGQFTSPATAMLPPSFFCEPGKAWDGGEENVLGLG